MWHQSKFLPLNEHSDDWKHTNFLFFYTKDRNGENKEFRKQIKRLTYKKALTGQITIARNYPQTKTKLTSSKPREVLEDGIMSWGVG